jgi:hypoxanthine phosphoribosyltransferase
MNTIKVKDKEFAVSIPEEKILTEVERLAACLNHDLAGKNPLFLCVLNGSFMFAADLFRRINIPAEISFVKLSSYQGTASTGKVKELVGLAEDITGRTVVVVEDIVDTGYTMKGLLADLVSRGPEAVHVCTLLLKPDKLKVPLDIKYVALEIPNDFIVGYGLDYDGYGRNLRDIYTVVD